MIEATDSNSVLLGYDKFGHPLYKVIATPKEKEETEIWQADVREL